MMLAKFLKPLAIVAAFLAAPLEASAQTIGSPLDLSDIMNAPVQIPADQLVDVRVTDRENGRAISLNDLANPDSSFYRDQGTFRVTGARKRVIEAAARGVGIRGGFAYESERINKILMAARYRNALNAHYPFQRLLLQNGYVVPPVITRVNNVRELSGPNYLYLTVGSYEITREARLTTIAPTWMDYLLLPIRSVSPPDDIQLEGADEYALWRSTVKDSWVTGVREARAAFTTALATLNRDYNGMALYHQLAQQGAVSLPTVDVSNRRWRVTEDGQRAFEGETSIRITVASRFRARG